MNAIELYMNDIQPCRRCGGLCNREHFAKEPLPPDTVLTFLYCERCDYGVKTLFEQKGGFWVSQFDMEYSRDKPAELEEFLRELRDARSVAA